MVLFVVLSCVCLEGYEFHSEQVGEDGIAAVGFGEPEVALQLGDGLVAGGVQAVEGFEVEVFLQVEYGLQEVVVLFLSVLLVDDLVLCLAHIVWGFGG